MVFSLDYIIMTVTAAVILLLLIFAVDWRYFRDWVVVLLLKALINIVAGTVVVEKGLITYPVRLFPQHFQSCLLFELLVFPVLCVLYNQVTINKGLWPIFYYAALFSAGITALEVSLERYTAIIQYVHWDWYISLISLTLSFMLSRAFIAFYRWGCRHFGERTWS